jgi:broad specificity phosphatase PhoE
MEIYLIRHGEIAGDPHRHYQPPVEGCLSESGCAQAQQLADALGAIRFDAIYASPLGRAIQTAQPLAKQQGLTIGVLPWLIEWRPAAVLGTSDEANYEEMERIAAGLRREKCWKTAAGEGTLEMAHRVIPGFLEMLEGHGVEPGYGGYLFQGEPHEQRIALFGHGGSLGQLAAFLLGVPLAPHPPISFALTGVAVFQFVRRADVWYPVLRLAQPGESHIG